MKKIGIICAGDREVAPFLPHIQDDKVTEKALLHIHEGILAGKEAAVLYSGVCKVNAAIACQVLIDHYGVDAVINAGTAGGIDPALDIFDTAIATEVAHHDVAPGILTEFHPWLPSIWFPAGPALLSAARKTAAQTEARTVFGRMVSGEAFIADEGRERLIDQFHPLATDMETAAIAQVCHANGVPFLAARCITDTATHSGSAHFEENCARAAAIAKDFVLALLQNL